MKGYLTKAAKVFILILLLSFCFISFLHSKSEGSVEEIRKEKEKIERLIRKSEKTDIESRREMETISRKLTRSFFSDTGLKILTVICLFLSLVFFFRMRNYPMAIVFYVLANILVFFGYKISRLLFR